MVLLLSCTMGSSDLSTEIWAARRLTKYTYTKEITAFAVPTGK